MQRIQYAAPRRLSTRSMSLARMEYLNTHSRVRHMAREHGVKPCDRWEWIVCCEAQRKCAPQVGGGFLAWTDFDRKEKPTEPRDIALVTLAQWGARYRMDTLAFRDQLAGHRPGVLLAYAKARALAKAEAA